MLEPVAPGLTGLNVSPLCFGTGTQGWNHRSNQSDLGGDRLADLLQYGHERGITFWDTADQYGTHPHIAEALRRVKREEVTITSKTVSRDAAGVSNDVERFLRHRRVRLGRCGFGADKLRGTLDGRRPAQGRASH